MCAIREDLSEWKFTDEPTKETMTTTTTTAPPPQTTKQKEFSKIAHQKIRYRTKRHTAPKKESRTRAQKPFE